MKAGDRLTWLHEPRGGYGYQIPVAAVVEKVGPKRVKISVMKTTGEVVSRWVSPERLREVGR